MSAHPAAEPVASSPTTTQPDTPQAAAAAAPPAAAAAAEQDSSSNDASNSGTTFTMFVAKSSNPGKVAGSLLARLEENPNTTVKLQASGRTAAYLAMISLVFANNLFSTQQRRQIRYQPQAGSSSTPFPEHLETGLRWAFYVRADPGQLPSPLTEDDPVAKVAEQTDLDKLAGVIERHMLEKGKYVVQCVGEGASYQALKAIKRVRMRLVQSNNMDFYIVPDRVQGLGSGDGPGVWVNRLHLFKCEAREEDVRRLR